MIRFYDKKTETEIVITASKSQDRNLIDVIKESEENQDVDAQDLQSGGLRSERSKPTSGTPHSQN